MKTLVSIPLCCIFLLASCDTGPNTHNCDFDESAMLSNYADGLIIPRFGSLRDALVLLDASVDAFVNEPSIGLLNEARIMYGASYKAYQRCSPLAFGPALIGGVPFRDRFNTFPVNVSELESNVSAGVPVQSSARATVGFPAIDYLLFGESGTTDQQIVDRFSTGINATARRDYLQQLTAELLSTTTQIHQGWSSYRDAFVGNTGTSAGSSISLLTNQLNYDFETLKNFKFKIPLGKLNGGAVLPHQVEGYYVGRSVELALEQVIGLEELFLGVGENMADGLGLDDYLICLDATSGDRPLAEVIFERFESIRTALEQVPDPLSETLVSNKPVVDVAYNEMQMMVPLIKVEMTSALGVQVSYQDNDGD